MSFSHKFVNEFHFSSNFDHQEHGLSGYMYPESWDMKLESFILILSTKVPRILKYSLWVSLLEWFTNVSKVS